MKEVLLDKITNWTQESADAFYDYKLVNCGESKKYIWQEDSQGMFLVKDTAAFYFNTNGTIYKITKWSDDQEWKNFQELFENNTDLLLEKPIYFEKINDEFNYTVVERPGGTLGTTFFELFLSEKIDNDIINKFIDSVSLLISRMPETCPLPPKPVLINNNICWTDFKYWKYTKQEFVQHFFAMLERISDSKTLLNKAKEQWTI